MRERPQAVDAGVGPEVDDDHLPAERGHRQRLRVDPGLDRPELRGEAEVVQALLLGEPGPADEILQLALGGGALLEPLECARVLGDAGLQLLVDPEDHQHRHGEDGGAERPPDRRGVRPRAAQVEAAPSGEREAEEDEARAQPVGERDREGAQREVLRRGHGGDGRDDRSGARREQEPEAEAEDEAAARVARRAPGEGVERAAEQVAEPRPHEAEADDHDDRDGEVPQEVVGEPERGEERRRGQREHREAHDEARPPRRTAAAGRRSRRRRARSAGRAGRTARARSRCPRRTPRPGAAASAFDASCGF